MRRMVTQVVVNLAEGKAASVQEMSDERVLALAELRLSDEDDKRLGDLLDTQQAGELTAANRTELALLIQRYEEGLLFKSEALAEAVARKLITHEDTLLTTSK